MGYVVIISLPVILAFLIMAIACYLLGRASGRSEAARVPQFYGPPPPPVGAQSSPHDKPITVQIICSMSLYLWILCFYLCKCNRLICIVSLSKFFYAQIFCFFNFYIYFIYLFTFINLKNHLFFKRFELKTSSIAQSSGMVF